MKTRLMFKVVPLFAALLCAATARAAVCTVPSAPHPTVQVAVDDLGCTEIVLGAQTFTESVTIDRSLELGGASSTATIIEGRVLVEGASTQVTLRDLAVDGSAPSVAGCFKEALVAEGGAQLSANDVVVVNSDGEACLLFRDGFESGNTSAWASVTP